MAKWKRKVGAKIAHYFESERLDNLDCMTAICGMAIHPENLVDNPVPTYPCGSCNRYIRRRELMLS